MKTARVLLFFALFLPQSALLGQDWMPVQQVDESGKISGFRNYAEIPSLNLKIPTEVTVYINAPDISSSFVGVFDKSTNMFVYNLLVDYADLGRIMKIENNNNLLYFNLHDSNFGTFSDFSIDGNGVGKTVLHVEFTKPINSSSITVSFDKNVSLPDLVSLVAKDDLGKDIILINKMKPTSNILNFPRTKSSKWAIAMDFSQPLRITEFNFNNEVISLNRKGVKFIALPDHTYTLYLNQEVPTQVFSGQNVPVIYTNSESPRSLGPLQVLSNERFSPADGDKDGIPNYADNCQNVSNYDQLDVDNNGTGNLCEDYDKDRVLNYTDNCAETVNYDQRDTDGDLVGDACDPDESRLTEKYPIVVWFSLGLSALVFIGLLYNVLKKVKSSSDSNSNKPTVG
ncbi:MAG: thrombospondin type 3 repeat-containing protein [Minisyncoccia bacterium]